MTSTERITRELLEAAGDPAMLEAVFRRHSHSKGPLYNALGEATVEVRRQLEQALKEREETKAKQSRLQQQVDSLETQHHELEAKNLDLEQQVREGEGKLGLVQGLLNRADDLRRRGFGEAELARLAELLGQIAADQGSPPEEGVAQFFQTVARYERVVSLDLEARRAEARAEQARAEAERWETEAKSREAHSTARIATIDMVERLLARGVKEQDLCSWNAILDEAGLSPDELAQSLREYGSLEGLCRERRQRAEEEERHFKEMEARLQALKGEQARVQGAITAVRDDALKEIERTSQQARQQLRTLVAEARKYGELQRIAAQLEGELAAAHALKSQRPEDWAQVPRNVVLNLLLGLVKWARAMPGLEPTSPPEHVCLSSGLYRSNKVHLWHLLSWASLAVLTDEERQLVEKGS